MSPELTRSNVLIVAGLALVIAPALVPMQPVLMHDSARSTFQNESALEDEGYRVVEYEALSERGQEIYVATLEHDGTYTVSLDDGAADFRYPTPEELGAVDSHRGRVALEYVVVERPSNASLPPADERVERASEIVERSEEKAVGERTVDSNMSVEAVRAQIARYDVVETRTTNRELTSRPALVRFGTAALGVLLVGFGGYRSCRPRR